MARDIQAFAAGRRVLDAAVSHRPIVATDPDKFQAGLKGRVIERARRMGKWVALDLSGGGALLAHLKMTGQFLARKWPEGVPLDPSLDFPNSLWPAHAHAAILLEGPGDNALFYKDTRKFGRLRLFSAGELGPFLETLSLGPDPLAITPEDFYARLSSGKKSLKAALLDQSAVSGLGNIYVDESLFKAGFSPKHPAWLLTKDQAFSLLEAVRAVLTEAIELRGSTVSSYKSLGESGAFQDRHQVYGKAGCFCPRCGGALSRSVVAGRTTVSCPVCQKDPAR
jgi:formamidopyrimidine-DNA glycosylase